MMMTSVLEAELDVASFVVSVTAAVGSAGQPLSDAPRPTVRVGIEVPTPGSPIEYKVGSADWAPLGVGQGVALPVDLSATPVLLRNASPAAARVRCTTTSAAALCTGGRPDGLGGALRGPALLMRRRWGALGDSITAQAAITGVPDVRGWSSNSYLTWLRRYLADAIDLPTERVYAVPNARVGAPAADGQPADNTVLDGQLRRALDDRLEVALVHMGTNSVDAVPTAALIEQFRQVYDALIGAGTFVVAIPIRVRGPAAQWNSAAKLQRLAQVNRFIRDYAFAHAGQMLCIDVNPALLDFSTGMVKAGLYLDDLHDNAPSAQLMGRVIADVLKPLLPAMDRRFTHLSDVFDPTDNPTGNLIGNGLFAGTGGNASINGATGQAANGWDLGRNNGNSTVSVVGGKAPDPLYTGMSDQTVTFGGTADGSTSFFGYFFNDVSSFSPGDRLCFDVECTGAMTTPALGGLTAILEVQDEHYNGIATSFDGLYQGGFGGLPADIGSFVMRTEPLVMPAGFRFVSARVQFQPIAGGGPIAGSVAFRRASLRKLAM